MRGLAKLVLSGSLVVIATSTARAGSALAAGASSSTAVIPISAPDLLGRVRRSGARATVVNVWATWCAPCRQEFPALLKVARAHEREGLKLVLVSADFDDQLPGVHAFLGKNGVRDTTFLKAGDDMTFINTLSRDWSGALPATFVYDPRGRLVSFWEGKADEARFEKAVRQALHSTP